MINVREVLETHSQATTLRELEAQGRSKVRVINAKEISRLIEAAVRQAIAGAGGQENVEALIERSKSEFRELKHQRDQEHAAREDGLRQLEKARTDLETLNSQVGEIKSAETASRTRAEELDGLLVKEREHSRELQELVDVLTKERDLARTAMPPFPASSSNPAMSGSTPEQAALLARLADQVAKLSDKMEKNPQAPVPAAASLNVDAMHAKLEALSTGIADRLDKFSRTLGTPGANSPGLVEAQAVCYDKMFESKEKLESNMGTVEVKQHKGAGIGGALDRMKKLRLGPSSGGSGT